MGFGNCSQDITGIFLAFVSVYYNDKVSPTGILLVFLHFSERFHDPATLSLADRFPESNSFILY
jgi:hypothetical protein